MKSLIVLISNPTAKKASQKKVALASYYLQSKGFAVEVFFTARRGDAENLAREAARKSPHLIVAAGGDGTINEVVNGIAGSDTPVAVLPLGTTNVLAKELGIPEGVKESMEIAVRGRPVVVSLGRITLTNPASPLTRYFCLMAGIGFDGAAVRGINETLKKISGKGAYIYSGMRTLSGFVPDSLTLTIDGKPHSGYSVIVGNASRYGGNFRATPDARIEDPNLYVCLFKGKRRLDTLRYVLGIINGSHLKFRDVEYLTAKHIKVDGEAHVQIDGDYLGLTPAEISAAPDCLRLVY
jgi:diacylglycerol kinase (ATP)